MSDTKDFMCRWPHELVEKIDAARGDVPRNKFIQRALEDSLRAHGTGTFTAFPQTTGIAQYVATGGAPLRVVSSSSGGPQPTSQRVEGESHDEPGGSPG